MPADLGNHQAPDPPRTDPLPSPETLTASLCRIHKLAITGDCAKCRTLVPANTGRWPDKVCRTPLVELLWEQRLKCPKCGQPFAGIIVDVGYTVMGERERVAEWRRSG